MTTIDGAGTTPIPIKWGNSDQNSDHGEFEPPEFKSTVNLYKKGNSDHSPSFLPGKTQTMVRVNCQNGDGGGSWVGHTMRHKNITYPKNSTQTIVEITVARSELFRIKFGKLPDTYWIYVSCETLPA